ncbi:MAG: putative cytokinetic ring protein SteA [Limnochordia bacterium]|jgi:uncharacterized membrane-anchored protein
MTIKGSVRVDERTKRLVNRLQPGEIAVISHRDIDEVAAVSLIKAGAKAVINSEPSISGRYPNPGPLLLLEAGIPVIDLDVVLVEGEEIEIRDGAIWRGETDLGTGRVWTVDEAKEAMEQARRNLAGEIQKFVANTLTYAWKEKDCLLGPVALPPIKTPIRGRHVVIVVRGPNLKEDLLAIKSYIDEVEPVLIGVDGGADALVELGYRPQIIVGDMDSVSDEALRKGEEIIVHAYQDGKAPGLARVEKLGKFAHILPLPGTSEDMAFLLAYEMGADLMVAVGSHSNMIDFLEKGRPGMASTFLVRMKVGDLLVDAKGVSKLYQGKPKLIHYWKLAAAACLPVIALLLASDSLQQVGRLLVLALRVVFAR